MKKLKLQEMRRLLFICNVLLFACTASLAQAIEKGYHGLVEAGYSLVYFGSSSTKVNWGEINTVHGYQATPNLFVGAGVGFHFVPEVKDGDIGGKPHWKRDTSMEIPLFADFRWTILNKRVTPFIDLRLGHDLTNGSGMYQCLNIGCRFALKNNYAINAMIALDSHKLKFQQLYSVKTGKYDYEWNYRDVTDESQQGLVLKVGFEF